MVKYLQLSINVKSFQAGQISNLIETYKPYFICFENACDQEIFDVAVPHTDSPRWRQQKITALFDDDFQYDSLLSNINQTLPNATLDVLTLSDQDWQGQWKKTLKPVFISNSLVICPEQCHVDTSSTVIFLSPGMAFGTGSHETTRLCLQHIERIEGLTSKSLIDIGCGSGILGIAAAKLGVESAIGVDVDDKAVTVAKDNARKNRVEDKFLVYSNDDFFLRYNQLKADIVVANILSHTLIELASTIIRLLDVGGIILLSGILKSQVESVKKAYGSKFNFVVYNENDWVLLKSKHLV